MEANLENKNINENINQSKNYKNYIIPLLIFAVVVFIFKVIFLHGFVPTKSMQDTINPGDFFIAKRLAYQNKEPEREDVIVFHTDSYKNDVLLVKRIIGLPGETIKLEGKDIYIDNKLYKDKYKTNKDSEYGPLEVKLKDNEYFVMGDNRDNSFDARFWDKHYIKRDEIKAKVNTVYRWPNLFKGRKGYIKKIKH